jgi:hypothetical protein
LLIRDNQFKCFYGYIHIDKDDSKNIVIYDSNHYHAISYDGSEGYNYSSYHLDKYTFNYRSID